MFKLNRKKRYEIIKEIINKTDLTVINEVVSKIHPNDTNDIEERREELLTYLEEVDTYFNEKHVDLTDRQYIKVIADEEEGPKQKTIGNIQK